MNRNASVMAKFPSAERGSVTRSSTGLFKLGKINPDAFRRMEFLRVTDPRSEKTGLTDALP